MEHETEVMPSYSMADIGYPRSFMAFGKTRLKLVRKGSESPEDVGFQSRPRNRSNPTSASARSPGSFSVRMAELIIYLLLRHLYAASPTPRSFPNSCLTLKLRAMSPNASHRPRRWIASRC